MGSGSCRSQQLLHIRIAADYAIQTYDIGPQFFIPGRQIHEIAVVILYTLIVASSLRFLSGNLYVGRGPIHLYGFAQACVEQLVLHNPHPSADIQKSTVFAFIS